MVRRVMISLSTQSLILAKVGPTRLMRTTWVCTQTRVMYPNLRASSRR